MHILHLNQRNQRNQILFQYLRDKKKKETRGLRKRGGGENSPILPPLDLRVHVWNVYCVVTNRSFNSVRANCRYNLFLCGNFQINQAHTKINIRGIE